MKGKLTLMGIFICLAVMTLTKALPTEHNIQVRRTRLCGRQLVDILAFLCSNEYYEPQPLRKRGGKSQYSWKMRKEPQLNLAGFLVDERSPFNRNSLFFRKRRGVSDECCKKSCTYHELTSYCKHTPSYEVFK